MSINDVQNLKKIREIKTQYGFKSNAKLKIERNILDKLKTPEVHLRKRLRGLEMEDEFLLLLLMVAEIEQVTKLDQRQIENKEKYTVPDYLLSVILPKEMGKTEQPMAQRMFVEVKKCKENEFEFYITKQAFQKLRYYSQLYTLPLYFAIKFDTSNIKQWFFISGKVIEKFGKQKIKKVNNRNQDCYVISIEDILKKDMSGLWLNNHVALLSKGTVITKLYDKSITKANMIDKKLGALISHSIEFKDKKIDKNLTKKDLFIEAGVFSTLLKKLSQGKRKQKKSDKKTEITFTADNNYFVPYYYIILETYLHLRQQFKQTLKENDSSIEYYINNFSDFDRNLLNFVKKGYYDLVNNGLLFPVKMMPNLKNEEKSK